MLIQVDLRKVAVGDADEELLGTEMCVQVAQREVAFGDADKELHSEDKICFSGLSKEGSSSWRC